MKRILLGALIALLPLAAGAAEPEDADANTETAVFVGRLLSIEELPDPCEGSEDCVSMDSLYRARYEIVQPITGAFSGREISFNIADHYGFPRFAKYQHALLFVGMSKEGAWLHKYHGIAVHRTTEGRWASCGEIQYREKGEPPSTHIKPLQFEHEIAGVGDMSEAGWRETLREWSTARDHLDHRIEDGKVWCTRGVELPDVYETMREGVLPARGVVLPAWSDTALQK